RVRRQPRPENLEGVLVGPGLVSLAGRRTEDLPPKTFAHGGAGCDGGGKFARIRIAAVEIETSVELDRAVYVRVALSLAIHTHSVEVLEAEAQRIDELVAAGAAWV